MQTDQFIVQFGACGFIQKKCFPVNTDQTDKYGPFIIKKGSNMYGSHEIMNHNYKSKSGYLVTKIYKYHHSMKCTILLI